MSISTKRTPFNYYHGEDIIQKLLISDSIGKI